MKPSTMSACLFIAPARCFAKKSGPSSRRRPSPNHEIETFLHVRQSKARCIMSNNHDRERELQLDNHIAALRDERTPDGPSPHLMQATMKRIDSVTGRRTILE